jgi:hypothetical protein
VKRHGRSSLTSRCVAERSASPDDHCGFDHARGTSAPDDVIRRHRIGTGLWAAAAAYLGAAATMGLVFASRPRHGCWTGSPITTRTGPCTSASSPAPTLPTGHCWRACTSPTTSPGRVRGRAAAPAAIGPVARGRIVAASRNRPCRCPAGDLVPSGLLRVFRRGGRHRPHRPGRSGRADRRRLHAHRRARIRTRDPPAATRPAGDLLSADHGRR